MSRSKGNTDIKELKALQKRFEALTNKEQDYFQEELVKEKVKFFLGSAVRLTPVGQYSDGRVGGTLRRGWISETQTEAQNNAANVPTPSAIDGYIENTLSVTKKGKTYSIEVVNNVEYASYVNYGHRTRGGGDYVNGQFMLEKALAETGTQSTKILDRKFNQLLKGVF